MSEPRLRIALQKKGRLAEDSFALLKACGLRFAIRGGGLLARVKNMPIDLLLVRDDDIPTFVSNDAADIGIVGENVFAEEQLTTDLDAEIALDLIYGPLFYRLLAGHAPLDEAFAGAVVDLALSGLTDTPR